MRTVLLLSVLLTACAPVREEAAEGTSFGSDYVSALFAIHVSTLGGNHERGKLFLADQELGCEDLNEYGEYSAWQLDDGVPYVQLWVNHGNQLDGWLRNYVAYQLWIDENLPQDEEQAFFWGQMGEGGNGGEPPPVDGRANEVSLGTGQGTQEQYVAVQRSSETRLSGRLEYDDEQIRFDATKCGFYETDWF